MDTPPEEKGSAKQFLTALQERFSAELLPPSKMRQFIAQKVEDAKNNNTKHLNQPEYAFQNCCAVPIMFDHMRTVEPSKDKRKKAFLSEFYRNMRDFHENSSRRYAHHPFEKSSRQATEIFRRWCGAELNKTGKAIQALHQACPDMAFGDPFPYCTLFETKYFQKGNAVRALVDGVYEVFYYLAMPQSLATKTHSAWNYRYGCLLAYDATSKGTLYEAWHSIKPGVRSGFWEGSNIFVMILRPEEIAT